MTRTPDWQWPPAWDGFDNDDEDAAWLADVLERNREFHARTDAFVELVVHDIVNVGGGWLNRPESS